MLAFSPAGPSSAGGRGAACDSCGGQHRSSSCSQTVPLRNGSAYRRRSGRQARSPITAAAAGAADPRRQWLLLPAAIGGGAAAGGVGCSGDCSQRRRLAVWSGARGSVPASGACRCRRCRAVGGSGAAAGCISPPCSSGVTAAAPRRRRLWLWRFAGQRQGCQAPCRGASSLTLHPLHIRRLGILSHCDANLDSHPCCTKPPQRKQALPKPGLQLHTSQPFLGNYNGILVMSTLQESAQREAVQRLRTSFQLPFARLADDAQPSGGDA